MNNWDSLRMLVGMILLAWIFAGLVMVATAPLWLLLWLVLR